MSAWGQQMGTDLSRAAQQQHMQQHMQQRFRGAWPSDDKLHARDVKDVGGEGHETGVEPPLGGDERDGVHAASAAMFRSVEAKLVQLQEKRDALADFKGDEEERHDEKGFDNCEKPGASTLVGLLSEVEELEKAVERMGIEADEQYARELVELEDYSA